MNKDVILQDGLDDIYPLAHADHNNEIIVDTYFRKNTHTFKINSNNWQMADDYYYYNLTKDEYPEMEYVKETDVPIWDIVVNPADSGSSTDYKTQIKYRAWCTTLLTFNGSMRLISTNKPDEPITLLVMGLKLKK